MSQKRKKPSAEFKTKVVLEVNGTTLRARSEQKRTLAQ
ncbi:hypothetical protein Psal006b_02366 [Piscirickettsia salmonis]|uniref:Transposase n=1 Tax=Piscirickettsia salmonis TaxID=1238 RepID=A0AAC8VH13_PISSA|nr:hypothetical protein KU39_841 [Piscirickettsia salmonis]ALB22272.1 hypothetical protein KU39_1089 [Piscirickettsia salmonis]QGN99118.1 hypothetical protein Psal006b_02120 [Piscirickettsia salmonis]QGN99361.1 hypothetical protein Psal006b_02366 [Piscirickettsia salmonis]QGO02747.1 hypothetical protein Psal008_02138 [Piscirickettsia salmonis]